MGIGELKINIRDLYLSGWTECNKSTKLSDNHIPLTK